VAVLVVDGQRSAVTIRRDGQLAGLRALTAAAEEPAALVAEARWVLAALGGAPGTLVLAGSGTAAVRAAVSGAGLAPTVAWLPEVAALPLGAAEDLSACAVAAGLVIGAGRSATASLTFARGREPATRRARVPVALAATAAVLGVLDWGIVRHGLVRQDARLRTAIHDEAAAVLPEGRLAAPRAELEAAVASARQRMAPAGASGPLALLHELTTHLPAALRLDVDELVIAPDAVSLHGRTESFEAVDALARALARSRLLGEVAAADTRTTVDGRQVEFRLRATRRVEGEISS
jgi:hypothetical protein